MDNYLPVLTAFFCAVGALGVLLSMALYKKYLIQKFALAEFQMRPRGFAPGVILASFFKSYLQFLRYFHSLQDKTMKAYLVLLFVLSFGPTVLLPFTGPFRLGESKHYFELSSAKSTVLFFIAMEILWSFVLILLNLRAARNLKGLRLRGLFKSFSAQQLMTLVLISLPLMAFKTLDLHSIVGNQNLGLSSYGAARYPLLALVCFAGLFLYEVVGHSSNRAESTEGHAPALRENEIYLSFWPGLKETIYGTALVIFFVCFFLGGYQTLPGLDGFVAQNENLEIPLQFISLFMKCALLQHFLLAMGLTLPHTVVQGIRKHFWTIFLLFVLISIPLSLRVL